MIILQGKLSKVGKKESSFCFTRILSLKVEFVNKFNVKKVII